MSTAKESMQYRNSHPEYSKVENRMRRARTKANRRLRERFRVEYEWFLMEVLKENEGKGESNE